MCIDRCRDRRMDRRADGCIKMLRQVKRQASVAMDRLPRQVEEKTAETSSETHLGIHRCNDMHMDMTSA